MERVVKTIRFPVEVLKEVRLVLDERNWNFTSFVIAAIKSYLRTLKYENGVNASFGAWKNSPHPEIENDVDDYIRKSRSNRTFNGLI